VALETCALGEERKISEGSKILREEVLEISKLVFAIS
jgi:hypothetical protein